MSKNCKLYSSGDALIGLGVAATLAALDAYVSHRSFISFTQRFQDSLGWSVLDVGLFSLMIKSVSGKRIRTCYISAGVLLAVVGAADYYRLEMGPILLLIGYFLGYFLVAGGWVILVMFILNALTHRCSCKDD